MRHNICILFYILAIGLGAAGQKNEGDSCVDDYTNTVGVCTPTEKCKWAKEDFQKNGIQPTFCVYVTFGDSLVCCRDGRSILQAAPRTTTTDPRPVWGGGEQMRVSERKCRVYSGGVVEQVSYFPLLPDPEVLSVTSSRCAYSRLELIVGGEDADQGEFPHMAGIGWANFEGGYSFLCGGSLISPRFVLSAGHCLSTPISTLQEPTPVVVRLGDHNIDPAVDDGAHPIDVPIRRAHKHPEYSPPLVYNDIALFELSVDITFTASVRPACLWTRDSPAPHTQAVATGWGVTDPNSRSPRRAAVLQKVSLSLLTNEYCSPLLVAIRNRKWTGFRDTQMCAGELRGGKDTCQGDSGSPLQVVSSDNQCIFYVMGVTSFGRRCAESGQPAVYTRVAAYLRWIEGVVWPGE